MSEQNLSFILENSCPVKDETNECPALNSIHLILIKDEIPTFQNNKSYHIEENVINKANNITLESFGVDAVNVLEIKTEIDDRYTGTQNSISIIEDSFLVKAEIDIKKEILTCLNNDDGNETCIENIPVNNDKSNNITIDTLNACVDIKTEKNFKNTSIQNSILDLEDGFSVKVEDDSFSNVNSSLSCSTYEENSSFQNNENNQSYEEVFNKIEQMSPEYCDIFKENIFEVKTEFDYKINNFGTSKNDLKCDQKDVKKHDTNQSNIPVNNDKSNNITIDTLNACVDIKTEKKFKNTSIQNSILDLEDGFSVKVEDDSFSNVNSSLSCFTYEENSSFQNNENNQSYEEIFNKIEQMSPEYCDIFKENIFEVKTEFGYKINNFGTSKNDLKSDQKYVKKHDTNQSKSITNCDQKIYRYVCQKSFSKNENTNTGKKGYTCDFCQKSFSIQQSLKRHMYTHTGEKPYTCDVCQKSFSIKENMKYHIFIHTGLKLHKCKICQKLFSMPQTLQRHMYTHTGEKPHTCKICKKSFSIQQSLKRHMYTHTGEKPYTCDICQKSFSTKDGIGKHMFTHNGVKPHKCQICKKLFSRTGNLKNHMLTHTGIKLHTCNMCQKSFSLNGNLKKHMLIHTGEKPHKCKICQKSFSIKQTLIHHIYTHTNEKPYTCQICQKSFSIQQNLKRHMHTHTGEKPYACDLCQKSFSQKGTLIQHMFTHTGKKLHKCKIRQKSFSVQQTLKRHMYTHTGEKL